MKRLCVFVAMCAAFGVMVMHPSAQAPAQTAAGPAAGKIIGGTLTPKTPDSRGWGWQVKAMMDPKTPRPLINRAKENLFNDKQITSYTVLGYDPDLYCEVGKHFDFVWFEMQHSTMSWDDIRRMLAACPRVGAAPMVRVPDALESTIQKATDIGALGVIVPTVDDAIEARDAARFSRYPPYGRRSAGNGYYNQLWTMPGLRDRDWINDNMLVVVMIETVEGVANADEIAATYGVDAVILGNNDLSQFSGYAQTDPRYQDLVIKVHDAALRQGKYFGNAGQQYLSGYTVSADTRIVQDGPARDGWQRPGRGGRGTEEPVLGLPGRGQSQR
jgi:2-keto-3-deoxy-L-rhamnonate aldolase RhmA